jgi:hypothetical protein
MRSACMAALLAGVAVGAVQAAEPRAAPPAQRAPEKVEPVDADFLEFLGSLDTEDEEWRQYLEDRPIKAAGKPAQQKPPPPAKQDPQQVKQEKKP